MSYSIAGDALSLDELVRIAESVELPEMLPPLNGAEVPEGF